MPARQAAPQRILPSAGRVCDEAEQPSHGHRIPEAIASLRFRFWRELHTALNIFLDDRQTPERHPHVGSRAIHPVS